MGTALRNTCERCELSPIETVSTVTLISPAEKLRPEGPFTAVPGGSGAGSVSCIGWILDVGCPRAGW